MSVIAEAVAVNNGGERGWTWKRGGGSKLKSESACALLACRGNIGFWERRSDGFKVSEGIFELFVCLFVLSASLLTLSPSRSPFASRVVFVSLFY